MPSTIPFFTTSTIIGLKNTTGTENVIHQAEEHRVLKTIVLVFLMILSIAANVTVSAVVLRDRELRLLVGNLVLTSLAFANLLMTQVMLFCMLSLLAVITDLPKQVCVVFTRLHGILVYVSVLHLFMLSIDKYVAVFYPLRYVQKFVVKRLMTGLCLVWIVPTVTIGVAPGFMDEKPNYQSSATIVECMSFPAYSTSERQRNYVFLNAVFLFGVPLLCMLVMYFKIAKVSWYQSNRVDHEPRDVATRARSARTRAREMKWAKTIGIMIGAFILCDLPIIVMLLRQASHGLEPTTSQAAILFLSFANTLINPFIYCLRSRDYRKAFLNFCKKDSDDISGCIASHSRRLTSKISKNYQKEENKGPGTAKLDNISELSTTSTSFSFVISRAVFQNILSEVLEDGET